MASLEDLQKQVEMIQSRNRSVELDKAWETSLVRRGLIMVCTYLAIGSYLWVIAVNRPWINAIVPTIGFFLSTLTLPIFRRIWERNRSTLD